MVTRMRRRKRSYVLETLRERKKRKLNWGLIVATCTACGLVFDVYFTHLHKIDHLDVAIVEYRLTGHGDEADRNAPYIDLALINQGDRYARYLGSTLHVLQPGEEHSYAFNAVSGDVRDLVEPGSIAGYELIFPALDGDKLREKYALSDSANSSIDVKLALVVKVMDSKGRIKEVGFDLQRIQFWKRGIRWEGGGKVVLQQNAIPHGRNALRVLGSGVFWGGFGISFNDGFETIFFPPPDSTSADSTVDSGSR